jgi:signal transduction histidine kinase
VKSLLLAKIGKVTANDLSLAILNDHGVGACVVAECGKILEQNQVAAQYLNRLGLCQAAQHLSEEELQVPLVVGSEADRRVSEADVLRVRIHEGSNPGERIVSFTEADFQAEVKSLVESLARLGSVGDLAASIAHQFNNTLTVVLGHADLLLAKLGEEDASAAALVSIRHQGSLASRLATKILRKRQPVGRELPIQDLAAATRLVVSVSYPGIHVDADIAPLAVELSRGHLFLTVDTLVNLLHARSEEACRITVLERDGGQSCLPTALFGIRNPWALLMIESGLSGADSMLTELKSEDDGLSGLLGALKHAGVHVFDGTNRFEIYLPRIC